jgi:cell division transport system ATP-binding protein
MTLLKLDTITKRFADGREALSGISFELEAGELAFLTGHSGAGKSTLLKLIHGGERPSAGTLTFLGRNVGRLRTRQLPGHRRQVGVVFQDHRLLADRSVFENVALPLLIDGLPREEIGRRVRHVLERLGLAGRERALPRMLSTGEQQRVGIARAVASQPPLLIADEPTGNLDPQLAAEVMELFATLPAQGSAVLVASHDLHLVRRMRRRVLVLEHGRMIDDFRPEATP